MWLLLKAEAIFKLGFFLGPDCCYQSESQEVSLRSDCYFQPESQKVSLLPAPLNLSIEDTSNLISRVGSQ
jgi:hypothetical protein